MGRAGELAHAARRRLVSEIRRAVTKPALGDGCSWAPDYIVTRRGVVNLVPCCEEHDRAYARGGSEDERLRADERLALCIRCAFGRLGLSGAFWSWLYLRAVRLWGGWPWASASVRGHAEGD